MDKLELKNIAVEQGLDFDGVIELVYEAQQAKVEELQNHAKEIHKREIKQFEKNLILTHERDELQKRVDAAHDALAELNEKSEALHHRWHILSDSVAQAEAEMIDMCIKELEQALKGEVDD